MFTLSYPQRVALVTGASNGIGTAIARVLAQADMQVAVHYHRDAANAERIGQECGPQSSLVQGDVGRPEDCDRMVREVLERYGRIDVLVNNAGVAERDGFELPYEDWQRHWQRTLDVNLLGAVHLAHRVVEAMRRQGGGKIINVSSRSAFRGETEYVAYAASKAALVNYTRCLARTLAPDRILAYAIAPGFIRTAMAEPLLAEHGEEIARQIPSGIIGEPIDVAHVALFLASDLSNYITGSTIDVNGGSYLH
jgi:3-oxoacyl-[acyl-carrier protein] reductase